MTYPNGRILHYGYDSGLDSAIGRVSFLADDNGSGDIGSHLQDYTYLGAGTIIGQTDGNGVTETTTLDQFGRTAEMKYVNGSSVTTDDFQYGYDQDGNVLYKINVLEPSLSQLYTYDDLNRVTSYEQGTLNTGDTAITGTPTASQSWIYDALGNQLAVTTNGTTTTNTVNSQNELTGFGSSTLGSDNDGNQTADQNGNTLVYDAWNRLISVSNGTTTLASYSYDATGRQATQTDGATTTDLYYSNQWQVLEERQAGTTTTQYVWSPTYVDEMVLRDDNSVSGSLGLSGSGLGERIYAQQDADWNVSALTDMSGDVQERFVYNPYGGDTVLDASGSSTSDAYHWIYLHQGARFDTSTGNYVIRNRDYVPVLARWIERDPAGDINGLNLYQYEIGNPVGMIDPEGLAILVTWNNGTQTQVQDPTINNFLAALQTGVNANLLATDITITGHGAHNLIEPGGTDGGLLTAANGQILDQNGRDITAALANALAGNATIHLQGCHTGNNNDSILFPGSSGSKSVAADFSRALPGVPVTGTSRYAARVGTNTTVGATRTFVNGTQLP